jgi:CBS domain-containing protein
MGELPHGLARGTVRQEGVITVLAYSSASGAVSFARLMWDCDCGSLPVVDDEGRAIAVVTDRDIAMTALFRDAPPSALPVSETMSKNIHFCQPDDSVASAEQIMRANQIRRLPVLNAERRLVGLLSMADMVRSAADKSRRKDVVPEEVTAIMADICSPRSAREGSARI